MNKTIHPAVSVTAGFFLILLLQLLESTSLYGVGACLLLLGWWCARTTWVRVLGRMRYLLLALFVLFAWQTPGTLLFPALGSLSPALEGVWLAVEQAIRLLGVASLVSLLLQRLDAAAWMCSLHVLLQPLRCVGVPLDRFILRLRLVLDQVAGERLEWRHALDAAVKEVPPEILCWQARALSGVDKLLLVLLFAVFLGVFAWQG